MKKLGKIHLLHFVYKQIGAYNNHCTRLMLNYFYHSKSMTAGEFSRYVASARAVLSLVRVIGEGALESVGSRGDRCRVN
jgi:hypothetical protein